MTPINELQKALEGIYLQVANEGLEKAKIERMAAEAQRANLEACLKEYRRPWRTLGAIVEKDDIGWKCAFQGVEAWGESPEMACDNFDHLWMFGNE